MQKYLEESLLARRGLRLPRWLFHLQPEQPLRQDGNRRLDGAKKSCKFTTTTAPLEATPRNDFRLLHRHERTGKYTVRATERILTHTSRTQVAYFHILTGEDVSYVISSYTFHTLEMASECLIHLLIRRKLHGSLKWILLSSGENDILLTYCFHHSKIKLFTLARPCNILCLLH